MGENLKKISYNQIIDHMIEALKDGGVIYIIKKNEEYEINVNAKGLKSAIEAGGWDVIVEIDCTNEDSSDKETAEWILDSYIEKNEILAELLD